MVYGNGTCCLYEQQCTKESVQKKSSWLLSVKLIDEKMHSHALGKSSNVTAT